MQYFSLLHRLNFIIFSWRGSVAARSAIFSIKIVLLCYIYSMHMSMARNYLKISKNIASLQSLLQKTFYFRNSYFQQIYNCIYMAFIIFFYIKFQNFLENFVIRIFQLRTRIFWNIWIVLSLLSDRKHVSVSQRPIKLIFEIDGFRTFH